MKDHDTVMRNAIHRFLGTSYEGGSTEPQPPGNGEQSINDVQGGIAKVGVVVKGVSSTVVRFATPFIKQPIVLLTTDSKTPDKRSVSVSNVSSMGFTLHVYNDLSSTRNVSVHWLAVEVD